MQKIFVRFRPLAGLYYWMMTDSQELLAEYARSGSEAAFRDLLTRYINLVYSTAVRLVDGDTYLAEDDCGGGSRKRSGDSGGCEACRSGGDGLSGKGSSQSGG